ncbi:unnamed protein product [Effrenium voratum]|uniref:JmjC domain-containing protein n=1 Tax=Effrenium voratum TaxID=2562239 RepID=A0AA36IS38_9DINO|nr:unnamed protein product [Effrenium voratum]CAJ1436640.1 unnamed protein product [Effrenium voratum]
MVRMRGLLLPCAAAWQSLGAPDFLALRDGQKDFSDLPCLEDGLEPLDAEWAQRPFVLRKCRGLLDRQADLEREALLEAVSGTQQEVRVGYSWSIAQNRGEGPRKMPLEDYLRHEMQTGLYDGETFLEPKYAFDMGLKLPGMPGREAIPKAIRDWNASSFSADQAVTLQMLGAARSAVGWHSHGASVQMTIFGRKRWFLYPRGQYPWGDGPGGGFSLTDWLQLVYPTLPEEQRPLECVVEAGDVVYVPDGWYHAVVNLADTVAVSFQSPQMALEPQEAFKAMSLQMVQGLWQEHPDQVKEIAEAAAAYLDQGLTNDLHARRVLFYCLMQMDPDKADKVILEGVARDPFHVPLQFELATWLAARAKEDDASALRRIRQLLPQWEPQLIANLRNQKAMWILNKFHRALGDEQTADRYFDRLVELNEKGIDR